MPDPGSDPLRLAGFSLDISQRKKVEARRDALSNPISLDAPTGFYRAGFGKAKISLV